MSIYTKTAEFASRFDAAYPQSLSERLEWWGSSLGIDRARLLRLIGMPSVEAHRRSSEDMQEILKNPRFQENAWLIEGRLHRLLSLYHYDWQTLARRIHEPLAGVAGVTGATGRMPGEVAGVVTSDGGLQGFFATLADIAAPPASIAPES